MGWVDKVRAIKVRTNADTPYDARKAVELGAEGIGLCRTEHMFFDTEERRLAIQEMIVADTLDGRIAALNKLLPFQKEDFKGIFKAMDGLPVTIRLVDPPLHEFVPHTEEKQKKLAQDIGVPFEKIRYRVEQLHESNPMLGHRGCRLTITYPEILDMQVRAIIEAACECAAAGIKVYPEIMIPLTIDKKELQILEIRTRQVADEIIKKQGRKTEIPCRHHDRSAAGGAAGRPDRRSGRIFLFRHQRPDPDDHGHLPRRRRQIPARIRR